QSSPVATYYDEVYKGNFAFLGVAIYDLERVEVLRGPQGTLYGSSSMGGTVRYITAQPNLAKVEGKIGTDLSATQGGGFNWG
ncbi:TonB-dependent receptor plug domain-containing protein, partial [Enterococcus faecalis]|uniref:TonB-dependent receptor plug domain-containing protein n=1 Tax=Enterococcus faecalis TaxID=1351 RepID=UPI00403F8195